MEPFLNPKLYGAWAHSGSPHLIRLKLSKICIHHVKIFFPLHISLIFSSENLFNTYLLLALSDVNISSKVTEESFLPILSIMSGGSVVGYKGKI